MGSQYTPAIDLFVDRSRVFIEQNQPKWIVIHKTAGGSSLEALYEYFNSNAGEASSHFGIDGDGNVGQFVRLEDGAAANCCTSSGHLPFLPDYTGQPGQTNLNTRTFSIEHIDPNPANQGPVSDKQLGASVALVRFLCEQWNIPMQHATADGGIYGHFEQDPVNKPDCPGNFPWQDFFNTLNPNHQGDIPMQNFGPSSQAFDAFFTANDNDHWQCKQNGMVVQFGIKAFYSQLSIDGQGLPVIGYPLSNETYHTVNDNNDVVFQLFERAVVLYDPNHTVDTAATPCCLLHLDDPRLVEVFPQLFPVQVEDVDLAKVDADLAQLQVDVAPKKKSGGS